MTGVYMGLHMYLLQYWIGGEGGIRSSSHISIPGGIEIERGSLATEFKYSTLDWQPIDCILEAWPLPKHQDVEPLKVIIYSTITNWICQRQSSSLLCTRV